MYPNRFGDLLSPSVWSGLNTVQVVEGSATLSYRAKERQSYWIFPREPGWRISFHFTMTFLRSQRWSAPPLPPSSHIPTEQPPLHCCLSLSFLFFLLVCQPIHLTLFTWIGQNDPLPPKPPTNKEIEFP